MAITTFREISLPVDLQNDEIQYLPKLNAIKITFYLSPIYRGADRGNLSLYEMDAFAYLEGSFRDQFPASNGPYGHYQNEEPVPFRNVVDRKSIVLFCSRSFEAGSSITEIPSISHIHF